MGLPDLLRNLYVGKETTIRSLYGTNYWFKIGRGVLHVCLLPPFKFNLYADNIMGNASLDKLQARIKIVERNINQLRYTYDITLMVESKEELKNLFESDRRE